MRLTGAPVAVVGAGTMGTGIAQIAAAAGHPVVLHDARPEAVDRALADLRRRFEREAAKGRLAGESAAVTAARVVPGGSLADLATAGLVVEAVVERLDVKRELFARLETVVGDGAVLATNTSSLSVTAIAAGLRHPERVVGMHFFNPAPVMPLVEVVSGAATAPEVAEAVADLAAQWGKTPVRCASTPGFVVNRVARPFYGEALRLLAERVADVATIDAVMTGAGGFRMGPFALMDLVGLDVNLAVSSSVYEQTFGDPRFAPSTVQQAMVDAGWLGRKCGRGFHRYDEGAAPAQPATVGVHRPPPDRVVAVGDLGHAAGVTWRLAAGGVAVDRRPADDGPGRLEIDGVAVVPAGALTATEAAAATGGETVTLDLAADWATATRVAAAAGDHAGGQPLERLAAALGPAGVAVSPVADTPGLIVMRTVCQLASVAADAVALGVASAADVDTAMRLGTNYPRGPLEWAEEIGIPAVVGALDGLRAYYGEERYRVAASLRRRVLVGVGPGSGTEP